MFREVFSILGTSVSHFSTHDHSSVLFKTQTPWLKLNYVAKYTTLNGQQ